MAEKNNIELTTRLVLCGDWSEFNNWLRADEFHGKNAVYVRDFRDVVGRSREKVEIIKYGTWYENLEAINTIERWLGVRIEEAQRPS